ncbi:uncharacterized protein EDB93DRAFT_1155989 [Suillus bovinus]|uniref:uncharacterized protein n=1 Tax=Suillus bovinus TaxID=48563 RepID=UPI001B862025|nr:uncharacterized protein EDB93DRAFT_1155989 [Suillus bovinus]KAG2143405.1 hypothetical protein EDB93DRAFT_1155989 [Suillus bovinus]
MTSVATTVPITFTSTNAYGSTTVVTTEISTTTSIPVSTSTPPPNNSNTGAIVGGVVGGIALLVLLGLVAFCLRRRRRRDEFDGNFDPDRVVSHPSGGGTLPQVDLGDENEITPYPGRADMRQYGESPFLAAGPAAAAGPAIHRATSPLSSPSQYSDTVTSPSEGYPSQGFIRPGPGQGQGQYPQGAPNMYAMQQADWHNPRPLTSPAPSVSNTSSSSRAMKEREAAAGRQGLGLATQQEVDGEGSGVVQHHDGGRAHSEEEAGEPRDIPPAYESIRQ